MTHGPFFSIVMIKMSSHADFNTTFLVDAGNVSMGHPSMFQTPKFDAQLTANIPQAKLTNPRDFWMDKTSIVSSDKNMASGYRVASDPLDPPLSRAEREAFIAKLGSLISKTLTNTQPTLLFYVFFSKQNFATLQKNIRYAVNRWSGYHVGEQSTIELTLVMESIFNSKSRNIDEYNAPSKVLFSYIRTEISRLNELVVNEAVPIIVNNLEQHKSFMTQVENGVTEKALQRPMDTSINGTQQLRSSLDILAGVQFT